MQTLNSPHVAALTLIERAQQLLNTAAHTLGPDIRITVEAGWVGGVRPYIAAVVKDYGGSAVSTAALTMTAAKLPAQIEGLRQDARRKLNRIPA